MTINLNPKIWGPHAWFFLDSIIISINNDNLQIYKSFFSNLGAVLPCAKCRIHFDEYIKSHPLTDVSNKDEFLIWFNTLHNEIRIWNGTSPRDIKSVLQFYNQQYNTSNIIPYCIIILAIMIFILIFFVRSR
uniref:thiol oxidase n=1 Tax=viral metagenome TaxID=1070528 RepID=A0A6C0M0D5_9ZZZZ